MPSRVSSKSSLSPSSTQGSSAIDLDKDSGVDMGKKSQVSASSGGIGVTQEITSIGGVSVTGGVSVDVSPINIDISGNPNYEDASKSSVSVAAGAEIPGGILGVAGGVVINTSTGQIEGGSIGGEVAGFGINISKSSEGVGIGISLQIPFSPISFELGFEFPDKKEEEKKIEPSTPPENIPAGYLAGCYASQKLKRDTENGEGIWRTVSNAGGRITTSAYWAFFPDATITTRGLWDEPYLEESHTLVGFASFYSVYEGSDYLIRNPDITFPLASFETLYGSFNPIVSIELKSFKVERSNPVEKFIANTNNPFNIVKNKITKGFRRNIVSLPGGERLHDLWARLQGLPWILNSTETYEIVFSCPDGRTPDQKPPELTIPPPPNPPPRKEMDQCCRDSMKMLRNLTTVMQVNNVLKGKIQIAGELIAIPEEGKTLPPETLLNYPQMVNAILLAVNRHGIDAPIVVEIEDTDKTTAGDQSAIYTYNSPGVAMQAALEMLHELKAAGNARLSIQIGIAFAVTRILKIVAGVSESIREIIKMLGMPFRYKPKKMQLEFNLAGMKKGYGKDSKPKEFTEMSKEELESIIPTLLEGSECDVPVPTFTPSEADDLRQMICKLTIRKEK